MRVEDGHPILGPCVVSCSFRFPALGRGRQLWGRGKDIGTRNLDVTLSPALCPWAGHTASLCLTKTGITSHFTGSLEGPCPSWICPPAEDSLIDRLLNLLSPGLSGTHIYGGSR